MRIVYFFESLFKGLTRVVLKRAKTFTATDYAIIKTTLVSMGLVIGGVFPSFAKRYVALFSVVFAVGYLYLVSLVFPFGKRG